MENKDNSNDDQLQKMNRTVAVILKTLMAFIGIAILSLGTTFLREAESDLIHLQR